MRTGKIPLVVIPLALAACLVLLASGSWVWRALSPKGGHTGFRWPGVRVEPGLGKAYLKQISATLYAYECEHGALPYRPSGPEAALYLLKPYLGGPAQEGIPHDVTLFDWPDCDQSIGGAARWDDVAKRLVGGDYDYLNPKPPPEPGDELEPDVVILAEKSGLRKKGKWVITRDFFVLHYLYRTRKGERDLQLLGKELLKLTGPSRDRPIRACMLFGRSGGRGRLSASLIA